MEEEEEAVSEVLYETLHHTTRPFSSNYPPQHQQADEGAKGGLLSRLSVPGVFQLKQKWTEYKYPKKLKKWTSLFVSPGGEHVAVASGNQITILQKNDNYKEQCGVYTGPNKNTIFLLGAWSDSHDVLGVVDDGYTLYFLKTNGEEIKRITKNELKISAPIVGLIVLSDPDKKSSHLCSFIVLTSDGLLHHIEDSQKPHALVLSMLTSNDHISPKKQFYQSVLCIDYHPEISLLVVVGVTDNISGKSSDKTEVYRLSLWHVQRNSDLELVSSGPQLEGSYSTPKGYEGPLTTPKVVISPKSRRIAVLDSIGGLEIFDLGEEHSSLSAINFSGRRKDLNGITSITWWSDRVLILAKMNGVVTMIDIFTSTRLLEDDMKFCMPVLERVQQCKGCVLLLDVTPSENEYSHFSSVQREAIVAQDEGLIIQERFNQLDFSKLTWNLLSFLEKSASEMYNILITNQQYQESLDFAHRHGLDKDEVFKSQWLHSSQEENDVHMFLSKIKDQAFVLSECLDKVGPTEEDVKTLLAYGLKITDRYKFLASEDGESSEIWDFRLARLQLLQFRDRLETFIGINMGRFALQDYRKFRTVPLNEAAVKLSKSGKIGALNLLFKRHPYSLAPFMLDVLAAIPETVPVQTYGQLLPGISPPTSISLRETDWVECENAVNYINNLRMNQSSSICVRTEHIIKISLGFVWPSVDELFVWYKSRIRDIENLSGQLDNCLCMLEFALQKGILELQPFKESILYLYHLIYSDDTDKEDITLNLADWEQLSDYEKFKMMLDKVKDDKIVERLRTRAIPFMKSQFPVIVSGSASEMTNHQHKHTESFLVRWLKETASDNKLDTCLVIIEEGCRNSHDDEIFRDEVEVIECALQCIYLCTLMDRWNSMASTLSKLPQIKDTGTVAESLEKRVKSAKGHVEAGRLLAYYQVPKPMSYFLGAHLDEKSVRQILRLILSKFARRQPGRSDIEWANMWRDMQLLQEKAFRFLDLEYMLMEFCRGLLKAAKFTLARNYLKGTTTVALATEKSENLVIQAAREYFYSASSLACTEIWKTKECLSLFPNSKNVKAEADIVDVLTVRLPNLGVTLLPMQFRQIRDPMEIIKMVITSHSGAYLNVDELIDIAKILGLSSQEDIAAVRESVAREAAVSGDLQLAFDQCLILAKTGHGSIWDLCAAIARGPVLDNVDIDSRKQLLSFALSHCDEESIGELLHAWKDLDMQSQCENLTMLTGTSPPNFSVQGSSIIALPGYSVHDIVRESDSSNMVPSVSEDDLELHFTKIKNVLSTVAKSSPVESQNSWDNLLRENGKVLTFSALKLPWLLELCKAEYGKSSTHDSKSNLGKGGQHISIRTQAVVTILSWLARNDIAPSDDLIASLARSVMELPVTEVEDILGCSFLLNLVDAFHGVGIIEEQLKAREGYHEVSSIMNIGMVYSSLHNSGMECGTPNKRRELLLRKFQEKPMPFTSDEMDKMDKVQFTFWREWKSKLEEQKLFNDQSRALKRIIPDVDTARFLSGDLQYMESIVFSLIDSVKQEKKTSLKEVLNLADCYGLNHTKVLLRYLTSVLISEVWENDDIVAEISGHKEDLLVCAAEVISIISSYIYPAVDGCNKQRLAYIYNILTDCYFQLKGMGNTSLVMHLDSKFTLELPQVYRVLEQECSRVSFVKNLNFKNIASLSDLNIKSFNDEVYDHIDEFTVEALACMVKTLVSIYVDPVPKGLISWQSVYKHYILNSLEGLVVRTKADIFVDPDSFKGFISELEQNYDCIKIYITYMTQQDLLDIMKQYYISCLLHNMSPQELPDEFKWLDCLIYLLKFWIKLTDDTQESVSSGSDEEKHIKFNLVSLSKCLKILINLLEEDKISTQQGWETALYYVNHGFGGFNAEVLNICRAMVFSGCQFDAINQIHSQDVVTHGQSLFSVADEGTVDKLGTLINLYVNMLDSILLELANESNNHPSLHNLLSTLSKTDGDLEDLKRVRCAVWRRLTSFADNMQLRSHVRVYTLELMQSITGRNLKGLSSGQQSDVEPWERWDESHCTTSGSEPVDQSATNSADVPNRFTGTLVALKSTRLASALSASIEITPDDLATPETAVSCFLNLLETAITEIHFKALEEILEEWEGLFTSEKDAEDRDETFDTGNSWGEDWDEGWESFQEEQPSGKEVKKDASISIHPLHTCWMQMIKKLISLSRFKDVFQLIDRSLAKPNVILLEEPDTQSLIQCVIEVDCFVALKLALLLPYKSIQLQCLDSFEAKLKQGIPDATDDQELFTLFLFSGLMTTIATDSSYGTTFSYISYMAGHFSRLCQESQLSENSATEGSTTVSDKFYILFKAILFPCFISELVRAKQPLLAGFMVSRFMHTNPSLNLVNVAEASLRRYLEGQMHMQKYPEIGFEGRMDTCLYLENTVSSLRGKLESLIFSALSLLSDTVK